MGRLIHADVPHTPPAYAPWLEPLGKGTNFALYLLLRGAMVRSRIRWQRLPERPDGHRPLLYLAWHRYNLALALALRTLPPESRPTLVMHDGWASRALTHELAVWMGFDVFVFHRRSPVSPRQQIADHVRERNVSLLILPDAGGPYGQVKPGSLHVAKTLGARVQPLAVRARGAAVLGRDLRHLVPLPGCELEATCGEPLEPHEATPEVSQHALEALDAPWG